jgi:hypothetical protein
VTGLVLTPFTAADAVELGNRLWRKKVLPIGEVEYKGRTLRFDRDYLGNLVRSFQSRAYDQVPFQLADAHNTHTNDPERTRGQIKGMELGDDGLYVTAELTPEGEKVLEANPGLGVSARIVEGYQRSDGKFFGQAVQHVLGTLDPRIPGLGAWQVVEAANPAPDVVFDLSAEHFAGEQPATLITQPPEGTDGMPGLGNLTDEKRARLDALLSLPAEQFSALTGVSEPGTEPGGDPGDGELSDAELEELVAAAEELDAAGLLDDEEEVPVPPEPQPAPAYAPNYAPPGEPVAAGLTADQQFALDLANARSEETQRELSVVTARLRESDYLAERDRLFSNFGVPPYVTDLARPLLEGANHVVEMSNGRAVDAGQVLRKVMTEMAQLGGLRDLSGAELGSPMDEPEGVRHAEAEQSREAVVSQFKAMTGLK